MTLLQETKADKVKIITIEGRGWREMYEEKPDGTTVLIYAFSANKENHDHNGATAMTIVEDMSWSEFCSKYQFNNKYQFNKQI